MERMQKSKKIWMIVGVVLLVIIVIVVGLKLCSKDETTDKGIKEEEKEIRIEEKESEDGLDVSGPEDADSKDSEGTVEFVGPNDATDYKDKVEGNNGAINGSGNDDVGSDTDGNDSNNGKTENKDNVGNLDEMDDNSSGGYGEFF